MAATGAQPLTTLLQRASLDDHEEVLRACQVALKKNKSDSAAQHAKAVALLKLERYHDAARVFEEAGNSLQSTAKLEYAYTLYKIGRLEEAAQIASKIEGQRGAKHIEAQSLYRAESFSKTSSLYASLSGDHIPSEDQDLRINQGAVQAQLQWQGHEELKYARPSREDLEVFETTYNAACGCVARQELSQAEILLKRAEELCKTSEDLSAEEKDAELLPIAVQQLYVLERLGKVDEAEKKESEIRAEKIPDLSTRLIAQNNALIVSKNDTNPFLRHKLFHTTSVVSESDKLFSFQSRAHAANAKIVDLQAFKFDGVAKSSAEAVAQASSSPTSPGITSLGVLNAASHAQNEIGAVALRRMLPELEKRPNDVGLMVTIIQMYLLTGNTSSAISLLESFLKRIEASNSDNDLDVRFSPGLVAILVALYKLQGRKAHIKQELAKAAVYWRHKSKAPSSLLKAAGTVLLNNPDSAVDISTASELFDKLRDQAPNDKSALAGVVASKALQSHGSIQSETERLTPVSDLIKGVDVETLEADGIPHASNALHVAQQKVSRKRPADGGQPKAKRIRKSRLPKDFEPGKKPDPERWLPLRDRSNYRPKGKKKGRKDGGDRTQGGVVADDVGVKESTTKASSTGGAGANKKKKGKGKK